MYNITSTPRSTSGVPSREVSGPVNPRSKARMDRGAKLVEKKTQQPQNYTCSVAAGIGDEEFVSHPVGKQRWDFNPVFREF